MGFMDELKKLTQPYEEEDDFFEGADVSFKPQPKAEAQPKTGTPQMVFESTFADEAPAPESQPAKGSEGGGFLGNLGIKRPAKPKSANRERLVNFGGKDTQVLLFSPKSFDEAGELVILGNQDGLLRRKVRQHISRGYNHAGQHRKRVRDLW